MQYTQYSHGVLICEDGTTTTVAELEAARALAKPLEEHFEEEGGNPLDPEADGAHGDAGDQGEGTGEGTDDGKPEGEEEEHDGAPVADSPASVKAK